MQFLIWKLAVPFPALGTVASWLLEIGKGSVSAPDQGMNSHLPAAHCRMGGPPCWEALNTERKAAFFLLPQSFDADRNRWGGSPPFFSCCAARDRRCLQDEWQSQNFCPAPSRQGQLFQVDSNQEVFCSHCPVLEGLEVRQC